MPPGIHAQQLQTIRQVDARVRYGHMRNLRQETAVDEQSLMTTVQELQILTGEAAYLTSAKVDRKCANESVQAPDRSANVLTKGKALRLVSKSAMRSSRAGTWKALARAV